jgi:hypothetical protein
MAHRVASGPAPAARRFAAFRADESGAMRTDMIVAGLAVVAVLGILVISDMNSADPVFGEAPAETAAAAPARTVSSVGFRAPEPEPQPGGASRQSYASPGYQERFTSAPDNEVARLDAATEAARAAEAAAGGPPPVAQAAPEAEAAPAGAESPAADEAIAADDAAQETPAGEGG